MKPSLLALSLVVIVAASVRAQAPLPAPGGPAAAVPAAQVVELPITRASLFASGVGYFEHAGTVDGDATMRLTFKTAQINDVLKSMVLMDLDKGTVQAVTYASQDPVERALRSFSLDISGNPTLPELLNQQRGAKVVLGGAQKLTGSILNVEKHVKVVGQPPTQITEWVLNLVTDTGIQAVPLESIGNITFADGKLRDELNQALALLFSARDTDRKPVDVRFTGQGRRRVRVGYLVETPVWKSSYRLDLSGDKPLLQGWAIVENTSDNDWSGVELSLVSGRPISFIQDLYTPLYLPRPVVRPEYFASLTPQRYEEGWMERPQMAEDRPAARQAAGKAAGGRARAAGPMAPAAAAAPEAFGMAADAALMQEPAPAPISLVSGVQAQARTGEVGELFHYTLANRVDLLRRRSSMLPIINDAVKADKVSIYNPSVHAKHPMNGAYLTNTTKLKMLAGPVTVFDGGTYGGDAQIDHLEPGDKRLISYALDLNMLVDPSVTSTTRIATGKIVKGVLEITHLTTYTQTYRIKNKAEAEKTLLIEQPFYPQRKLLEPAKPEEKTASLYRFKTTVKPNGEPQFVVKEEQTHGQLIALVRDPVDAFLAYSTNDAIPKPVRDALVKAIELKKALTDMERQLRKLEEEAKTLANEQSRLRSNLGSVGRNSPEGARFLKGLMEYEDRLEALHGKAGEPGLIETARQKMEKARADLEAYLGSLDVRG